MGTELSAFDKYLFSGGQINYHGNGNGISAFVDLLKPQNIHVNRDAPDMYIKKENTVLIVEHFEFDSYKVTRKGSEHRREIARIQRREDEVQPTEQGTMLHDVIHGESSYHNYISNATRSFNEHYSQIDLYIHNLTEENIITSQSSIKVMFFVEDASPLGTMVSDSNGELIPVTLAKSKEFLDLMGKCPRVDYVLACSAFNSSQEVWFIDQDDISSYVENAIDYSSMQFLSFTPQVIGYKLLVPENEKELKQGD